MGDMCQMVRKALPILALTWVSVLLFAFVGVNSSRASSSPEERVILERAPDGSIQPQAAMDERGTLHLIYFKGAPAAGDIYYVRRQARNNSFSNPIRVNSRPGSAIAMGSVRGAHLALGRGGRVHVAWMGSKAAEPKAIGGAAPMLYTRMNDEGTAFEPQRNVVQYATGLDGGGSVAADHAGNVYVAWHAGEEAQGDEARQVFVAVSGDDGKTFKREAPASSTEKGACGCCGMRAFAGGDGTLHILYRAATNGIDRDMYLLASEDKGASFKSTRVHEWRLEACPMSTAAIGEGAHGVQVAWETNGQIYYSGVGALTPSAGSRLISAAPGDGVRRKHPAIVMNSRGETLLLWTEKTDWQKGGALRWQIFDRDGRPAANTGSAEGVPVWSLVTAYARPDGGFTIIY